ncbi:hypothetical protein M409DRAFT_16109 [Zasmidium cellare ATCC 36951]|uniref:Uncharacterized protein n=1 Tax=Zasmidium cellare ATCC 36951 TaxID=1080233 RepID=A0A6A6D6P9_ZASCE|nr:uncharacterized protein M409DRAFT_16109 [Zasmidium cellare ATCC 36951]KAF2173839.1 hypothetical protein M409DRAFT_16109 [Zasmidium cellare ATCC 36951]
MSNGQPVPTKLRASYADVPYQEIKISHHPASSPTPTPVLILTLHRPKHNNAFTDIMTDEIEHFFALASIDDRVKVIVMTGHGRIFCAGQDLNQGFRLQGNGKNETDRTHRDGGGRASLAMHNCTKPTIVAINGHAIGVGITMTLPAVMRVAWSKAKIGFVFSRRGVVTEGCSSFFLPRLVGFSKTMQLLITGATLPASAKQLHGLFSDLVERQEDVLPKALEIADDLAVNTSSVSTYMIREMLYRGMPSAEEAHLLESRVMGHMRGKADNDEAVNAFLEKRKATFTATVQKDSPPVHPWHTPINVKNPAVADTSTNGKPRL